MRKATTVKTPTSEIDQLIKSKPDYLIGARLALIRLVSNGATLRDAADDLPFLTHSRIGVWVSRFNQLGVEGLKNKPIHGRAPLLSDKQLSELKELILNKLPSDYGYNTATWTGPLLIDLIKNHFGVQVKKATIYVLLKDRLGLSHQKGKGFYPEASLEQREPIIEDIKKKLSQIGPDAVVVYQDEASLSNTASVSYAWGIRGTQPKIQQKQRKRERCTLFGCVQPKTGQVVCMDAQRGNARTFFSFLLRVVKTYGHKKVYMVLDNVPYHHARIIKPILERYNHRIELLYLPPYSPDLNSMERIWWYMRKKISHNRYLNTLEQRLAMFYEFISTFNAPNDQGINLANLSIVL